MYCCQAVQNTGGGVGGLRWGFRFNGLVNNNDDDNDDRELTHILAQQNILYYLKNKNIYELIWDLLWPKNYAQIKKYIHLLTKSIFPER